MLKAAGPEGPRLQPTPEEEKTLQEKRLSAVDGGDADGYCLERYYSDPDSSTLGYTEWVWLDAGNHLFEEGYYYYHVDGQLYWFDAGTYAHPDGYSAQTWYNQGYMDSQGAGSSDWEFLYRHERAHQAGWDHFEGTEDENGCYWPEVTITGT
jgi:hypothetical protein